MSNSSSRVLPPLALIAGPTASGKSALAIDLARRVGGVVVNADASQVYADLAILSARPSPTEMAGIEHRLFGHVDGAQAHNAATWANEARREIAAIHAEGRWPVLVGGTGLYIRTLIDGIAPIPDIDPDIRALVRALPTDEAWAALNAEDPDAAARLNAGDSSRIARALEVVRSTGRSVLAWREARTGGIGGDVDVRGLVLDPPTSWLYPRCEMRFDAMMAADAEDEIAALMARGLDPALPVMRAIGVPPLIALAEGRIGRDEAMQTVKLTTRNYAKRQKTWFRNQVPANWTRATSYEDIDLSHIFEI